MKIHELQVVSTKNRKRVGRGISAGQGKTAGRGTKGQKARTGKKLRAGFEGGQTPFMQRIPKKKGFKSIRVPAQVVYTEQLGSLGVSTIDNDVLAEKGLIASPYHLVKIIKKGELKKAVKVKVQAASEGAIEAIKTAGGSFEKVTTPVKKATAKSTEEKK
ncbi:MAG TPA: 50S ribosomal protein L15 [Candidatus Saccharimonadales bacterium]|nr:50S ribosomal protein L15 [Candidatus Saccharimonadales bacterium]